MNAKALAEHAEAYGLKLSDVQLQAFALFEKELYLANTRMNLTRVPQEECWARHFLDSLVLNPLIPENAKVLDIGSGAGFPGAVIAIARPDVRVTCLDSSRKATDFLRGLFGSGGAIPVLHEIVVARAEEAAHESRFREAYDFVTGRAIAPFPVQIEISAAFVALRGLFVPLRTPRERNTIRDFPSAKLGLRLFELREIEVKPIEAIRLLPIFEKTERTPDEYPRPWVKMRKHPLRDERKPPSAHGRR
ncbi:MAG TPA: 16S rRNA (guanine(527)-N(7))-methyltransferase RsmG [Fimbriimonadales bacterium]|nr:16S rRNA (guanine(527)-N(7))-methyltransferase RsmG [Fimbriimonadales bacterium]